jgi:putative flippase GtrA
MITPNNRQKIRFVGVGVINTMIDFGVLFTLKAFGLPTIPSNIISTSAAFCFSFFANKKYTFKTTDTDVRRELVLFIIVTLFGLWVLQSAIIALVTGLLSPLQLSQDTALLAAKLCATAGSLVWNYVLYSRVVFKNPSVDNRRPTE